jgi:hypothetical protein
LTYSLTQTIDSMTSHHPPDIRESLRAELAAATVELKAHMATWEYAFAMGAGSQGAAGHPVHRATHARTERLTARCRDLSARLAEHEL